MIAIIDYKMGNIRSVENALRRLGAEYTVTANPVEINKADRVLLPGVGHAGEAMENLRAAKLPEVIRALRRTVLGNCVGMQVMCRHTEEGDAECLGLFDARVQRFAVTAQEKVPHVGWNQIGNLESKLFRDMKGGSFVYYVHSY